MPDINQLNTQIQGLLGQRVATLAEVRQKLGPQAAQASIIVRMR